MDLPTSERETLKSNLDLIDKVEAVMGDMPHKTAVVAIRHLTELRDTLCEALPGGFYCYCENCEMPIGCDEETATDESGDVRICGDCIKRYAATAVPTAA